MSDAEERERGTLPVPEPAAADDPRVLQFRRLLSLMDALRGPGGCPWDAEQTEASVAPCVVEEAHELAEAVDDAPPAARAAEAGDVLTALTLLCRVAEDEGSFDIGVAAGLAADKLVRRHPHVFASAEAEGAAGVVRSWEEIKRAEREEAGEADTSALAGVPRALPALQRAARTCQKAVAAGFHWKDARGALAKLEEELDELREALPVELLASAARPDVPEDGPVRAAIEHELGDVLMAAAFLGGYLGLDSEGLCRRAVARFDDRFRYMESSLGGSLAGRTLDEMMAAWRGAKAAEAEETR